MATQGAFEWQGRLETEGEVEFGPARWFTWLLFATAVLALVAVLAGLIGRNVWQVVVAVLLGAAAWYLATTAVTGSNRMVVTHDGFRMGTGQIIAFDRLVAVGTARGRVTVFYAPLDGERMSVFERRSGHKRVLLDLSRWGSVRADELAVWLLKLKGGPMSEVIARPGGAGVARIYQLPEDHA
jgi:hypothetical protein